MIKIRLFKQDDIDKHKFGHQQVSLNVRLMIKY